MQKKSLKLRNKSKIVIALDLSKEEFEKFAPKRNQELKTVLWGVIFMEQRYNWSPARTKQAVYDGLQRIHEKKYGKRYKKCTAE